MGPKLLSVSLPSPDNRVRTFSTRYLTANSHLPPQAARFGRCMATVFPSPLPGSCGTRRSRRQDTGPDGRSSPFRVFDLPASSRVAPSGIRQWQTCRAQS